MKIIQLLYIVCLSCFSFSCVGQQSDDPVSRPIRLDKRALSGLDLKQVKNGDDPDRILHQKRLVRGKDLSIYVVSSETKAVTWDSYGIEEFIYVINGRARLVPFGKQELFVSPGEFFVAPLGYQGDWETQAAGQNYIELSVIATKRQKGEQISPKAIVGLSAELMSGVNIPEQIDEKGFIELVHEGDQLAVEIIAENSVRNQLLRIDQDELLYVISGAATIKSKNGEEEQFFAGEFFVLPAGFSGTKTTEGHDLFRYLRVTSTYQE